MPRDKEYLLDIQEAAKLALTYIANKTKEDFLKIFSARMLLFGGLKL